MNESAKKIVIATSTRADWGLLYPLVKELSGRDDCNPIVIATYMHLFPEMGDTISELVADGFPPAMSIPARMEAPEAVADTVTGFSKAFRYFKPDMAVVLGDRFEIQGVAMAALLQRIPLAHIAGGTVSKGALDDSIRNSISQMAQVHFPETAKGRQRLILMGADPEFTVASGALGVYNALNTPLMPLKELEQSIDFELGEKFLLGTFHPATAIDMKAGDQMQIWLDALDMALNENESLNILLTFPNTDNEPNQLLSLMFTFATKWRGRVKIVDSLGRVRYLSAAAKAAVVAGNSSSGIVEIPSLKVPVVNVGSRQEGRLCSKAVIHAPLEAKAIARAIGEALTPEATRRANTLPNPYYRSNTPQLIADTILSYCNNR